MKKKPFVAFEMLMHIDTFFEKIFSDFRNDWSGKY